MMWSLFNGANLRELRKWWGQWARRHEDRELRRLEIQARRLEIQAPRLEVVEQGAEVAARLYQMAQPAQGFEADGEQLASPPVRELPRPDVG